MIKAKQVFFLTSNLKGHGFMVTKQPFSTWLQNIIHYLCCLKNLIFLKSVQYIKSYGHLNDNAENIEFKFSRVRRHLNQ